MTRQPCWHRDVRATRRVRVTAALVCGALVFSACTLPGEERVAEVDQVPEATPGGTLTVAVTPPAGIEPAFAHEPSGALVSSTMCLTLVTLDPTTGALRPGLAESWVVADRGASVLFKLRRGVTFTDGSPVDSKAVVESLRRLANPDTASFVADLLEPIAGYRQYRENVERGDLSTSAFRGARVNEPYSFELLFEGNYPDFVRTLAHPATAPVSTRAAARDPAGFARKPVCAGGYEMTEPYKPGNTEIRLRRAPGHGLEVPSVTRDGTGWADEIVFRLYPDAAAVADAYGRGEAEVAPLADQAVDRFGDDVVSGNGLQVEYIGLPYGQTSSFGDPAVRQAMSAAIDRGRIAAEVYEGTRRAATGFLPPVVGKAARDGACAFSAPPSPASPEQVRAAVGDAPLRITFNDEFRHRRLVEAVAAMWREAFGIAVEPEPLNWDEYLQRATTGSGFAGPFRVSWAPVVPGSVEYIEPLFGSARSGDTNLERYQSVELDDVLRREVRPATDEGDRIVKLQQLEDRLCRELPLLPIVVASTNTAIRGSVVRSARADGALVGATGMPLLLDMWRSSS